MRAFLAIDIPDDIKQSIDQQITPFKKEYSDMTWVTPENYHITLQFLGDITEPEKIEKKIEDAIFEIPPFTLFSQGADLFLGDKIVIYLNFFRQKVVEQLMENFRQQFDPQSTKPLVPHLTLARYRVPSKQQYLLIKKKIQNLEVEAEFSVNKIYLYSSILSGPKPEYKKIKEYTLES